MNNNTVEEEERRERRATVMDLRQKGFTLQAIAKELGVGKATVYNDLQATLNAAPVEVAAPSRHPRHFEVVGLLDAGHKIGAVVHMTGLGARQVRHIWDEERIERRGRAEASAPIVEWDSLPGRMKNKMETLRRQVQRELEADFEPRVVDEVQKRVHHAIGAIERRERDAARVLEGRKGVFTAAQYRLIKACLHPDSRDSVSPERLAEAFRLFNESDILLMDNRENPVSSLPPIEELLKRRKHAS